jgi:tetratricopeptide (TPR) repeat protein
VDSLLNDPVRSVRLAAAWALRGLLDLDSLPGRELLHMLDQNADQPSGQLQYGAFWFARNNPQAALEHYQKAVQWDANSAPIHHELAVAYSVLGKKKEALHELQEAVRLDPTQPEFFFKLALAWNETGNVDQTIKAIEQTVKLDPQHARAWYNLGLARNGKGDASGAIEALRKAEAASTGDASIPYARATIHLRMGQKEEAQEAAVRALQIDPQNQDAMQLLRVLAQKQR